MVSRSSAEPGTNSAACGVSWEQKPESRACWVMRASCVWIHAPSGLSRKGMVKSLVLKGRENEEHRNMDWDVRKTT